MDTYILAHEFRFGHDINTLIDPIAVSEENSKSEAEAFFGEDWFYEENEYLNDVINLHPQTEHWNAIVLYRVVRGRLDLLHRWNRNDIRLVYERFKEENE